MQGLQLSGIRLRSVLIFRPNLQKSFSMDSDSIPPSNPLSKDTGSLTEPSGTPQMAARVGGRAFISRGMLLRAGEQAIFVTGVIGAVALGLGITDYFRDHHYVAAYLLAYVGFRFADLLVGEDRPPETEPGSVSERRVIDAIALLVLFAAAPFERTYLYGGEAPSWLGALGLLLELGGLWLALGSRIQLHFFSSDRSGREQMVLVKTGFYRYIRHPAYGGILLVALAWPLEYGAPIVWVLTLIIGVTVAHREIKADEEVLVARFGEEFDEYRRTTDALIPSIW
jgi:protein-S-isoprenylcysteine O-methyltransferase Ste14